MCRIKRVYIKDVDEIAKKTTLSERMDWLASVMKTTGACGIRWPQMFFTPGPVVSILYPKAA